MKEAKKEDPEGQETTEYGKSVGEEKSTAESRPTTMEPSSSLSEDIITGPTNPKHMGFSPVRFFGRQYGV